MAKTGTDSVLSGNIVEDMHQLRVGLSSLRAVPWLPYHQIINDAVMRGTLKVLSLKPYVEKDLQYSWTVLKPLSLIRAKPVNLDIIELDFSNYQGLLHALL